MIAIRFTAGQGYGVYLDPTLWCPLLPSTLSILVFETEAAREERCKGDGEGDVRSRREVKAQQLSIHQREAPTILLRSIFYINFMVLLTDAIG